MSSGRLSHYILKEWQTIEAKNTSNTEKGAKVISLFAKTELAIAA